MPFPPACRRPGALARRSPRAVARDGCRKRLTAPSGPVPRFAAGPSYAARVMDGLFDQPRDLSAEVAARPFGAASRAEMLGEMLGDGDIAPAKAWLILYQLLLWIDSTTGLAHCYESDKCQPGRPWYERSLAFHAWLSDQLCVSPSQLGEQIDSFFRTATARLRAAQARQMQQRAGTYARQRARFAGREMPEPGADPNIERLIQAAASAAGGAEVPPRALRETTQALGLLHSAENNRRNLLGEGFEDALAFIMRRLPGGGPPVVDSRKLLHELPGFRVPPQGEKPRRVDLGIVTAAQRRVLVSVKWSIRADREEQFGVDFDTYARLESSGGDFEFVLITNEFDAARLKSAVQRRAPGRRVFDAVVHVCPEGVLATYGDSGRGAAEELPRFVADGRIRPLAEWLAAL